jgi:hypothetical protein
MRNGQARLLHDLVSAEQQVEVDRSRPEALAADTAHSPFDVEEAVEQLPGSELRFDLYRSVEERALLDGANGLGFPNLRNTANLDGVLGGKELDSP